MPLKVSALLVALFTLFTVGRAWAIGACLCPGIGYVGPRSHAVPSNLRLLVSLRDHDVRGTRLRGPDGDVSVELEPAGGGDHRVWLKPKQDLPRGRYKVIVPRLPRDPGQDAGAPWPSTSEFPIEINTGRDEMAPVLDAAELLAGGQNGVCDSGGISATLLVRGFRPDPGLGEMLVQIDVSTPDGPQRLFATGNAALESLPRVVIFGGESSGQGYGGIDCAGDARLRGGRPGVTYTADVTFWDAAGNGTVFRGLSFQLADPHVAEPSRHDGGAEPSRHDAGAVDTEPRHGGDGCSIGNRAPGGVGASFFVVVLLAAVGRRRPA